MAIITQPMIDDLVLTIRKDVANAEVTVDYDIHWSNFDQLTDLSYSERWELVGIDAGGNTTLYVGPMVVGGISSNGNATTHRTQVQTIAWTELDEDVNDDEIAAVVTFTPLLPVPRTRQSPQVVVTSP